MFKEKIFIELMTSDRKLKASREGPNTPDEEASMCDWSQRGGLGKESGGEVKTKHPTWLPRTHTKGFKLGCLGLRV